MFNGCNKLQSVTLGKDFKFVGTDGYLPTPSSTYIPQANGKWYDTSDGTGYTPKELASVTRTEARTYVAVKPAPTLAEGYSWYKGSMAIISTITAIEIKDSYTPSGTPTESWNADVDNSGSIKAYVEGTKLTIAGNGAGKIMANANSGGAFSGFVKVTAISGLDKLDTSKVTDMEGMFYNCQALTSLDVSGWDTSNVTRMAEMFYNCYKLTSLNLSGWNTSKVLRMDSMFYNCEALTSLDVSGFDTSNVLNMYSMFHDCSLLTSLDVSGFDTSKVTDMSSMFYGCKALTNVDVSGFDTSKVTTMEYMFGGCIRLTGLDLSGFDTSKVTNMYHMFGGCSALTSLDLSGFDTSNVTDMREMFSGCSALRKIYVSNLWSTSAVTGSNSSKMFNGCSKLSGAISYSSSKIDATYANYTTGYLTYKAAPARSMSIMSNGSEISGYSISE